MKKSNHVVPQGMRVVYQHINDANDPDGEYRRHVLDHPRRKLPYVTFALLMERDEVRASGMSICAPNDTPNRKLGNFIAKGRALKEFYEG